jgi:hypothetical protein
MTAACVRAQMLRDDDPEQGALADELADAFCTQARIRTEVLFHGLWHNADATNRRLAKHVVEGRYTWAEAGVLPPRGEQPSSPPTDGARGTREVDAHPTPQGMTARPIEGRSVT